MTERIAFQITRHVIDQCDVLIDNHCGDGNEDLTTYLYDTAIGDPLIDAKTKALAEAYGFQMIIHQEAQANDPSATWCANSALLAGKPALTIECGKLGRTDEEYIQAFLRGTNNILKHLKIIPGEPERIAEPVHVRRTTYVRSAHTGIWHPLVRGGQHVQKGELAGFLTDYFGNVIQEAFAPHDGIVMYIVATPPLSPGEPMVKVGGFE